MYAKSPIINGIKMILVVLEGSIKSCSSRSKKTVHLDLILAEFQTRHPSTFFFTILVCPSESSINYLWDVYS